MKYVIRNCPAILRVSKVCNSYDKALDDPCLCKDCTDCILKQIVELCKKKDYFVKRFPNTEFSSGVKNSELAFDILRLLQIEEVE